MLMSNVNVNVMHKVRKEGGKITCMPWQSLMAGC